MVMKRIVRAINRGLPAAIPLRVFDPGQFTLSDLPRKTIGSGQCVDLVRRVCGLGHTSTWVAGDPVYGNTTLKPGTPIACFDGYGMYGNHTDGTSHAAIYLGPSTKYLGGIRIYDQWVGHTPAPRDISISGEGCNNVMSYAVVKTA